MLHSRVCETPLGVGTLIRTTFSGTFGQRLSSTKPTESRTDMGCVCVWGVCVCIYVCMSPSSKWGLLPRPCCSPPSPPPLPQDCKGHCSPGGPGAPILRGVFRHVVSLSVVPSALMIGTCTSRAPISCRLVAQLRPFRCTSARDCSVSVCMCVVGMDHLSAYHADRITTEAP